jgi:hypothetical protein
VPPEELGGDPIGLLGASVRVGGVSAGEIDRSVPLEQLLGREIRERGGFMSGRRGHRGILS